MPDLSGNIPDHVFYGSVMSEFLRIARATLLYLDFVPKAKKLFFSYGQSMWRKEHDFTPTEESHHQS